VFANLPSAEQTSSLQVLLESLNIEIMQMKMVSQAATMHLGMLTVAQAMQHP
jgi:hypothetical protein